MRSIQASQGCPGSSQARHAPTPSFICELPLLTTAAEERQLLVRLDCARQVYNACLGESLKRLERMRASAEYVTAQLLPKGPRASATAKVRSAAFAAVRQQFGFREYALHTYAVQFSHSWLGEHLDSNTVQKLATRAFLATQRYAFGKVGKPRFKGQGGFESVEGKTNASGILWRENQVKWLGLELPARIEPRDPVIAHGLTCRVRFVRLVRRKLNDRNRFYAQLVCEGKPYRKPKNTIGVGVIGLDIGPSTLAIVSAVGDVVRLDRLADELKPQHKAIRKLQRKLDRQRRANNPDKYHPDGTVKQDARAWSCSKRYVYTRGQLAERQRRQAEYRKSLHGRKVNEILAQADTIRLEKLSYHAFQRRFGKSIGFRGPGALVARLRRKAESAGVEVVEFAPGPTRLSQVCVCGALVKKPLSQRWHVCNCGVGPVQRDLFSAWLACFVQDNRLDAGQVKAAWPSVDTRLRAASSAIEPAMGQGNPPVPAKGQSRSLRKSGEPVDEAGLSGHAIPAGESAVQPEPPLLPGLACQLRAD